MARKPKTKTYEQVLAIQAKAVRFLRDVVGDPDKADEIEDLSPEDYAERKGVVIVAENPSRFYHPTPRRATMTKSQMEERIAELEEENKDLRNRLDSIVDIVQPEAGDEDDDDEDDCDDDEDEGDEDEGDEDDRPYRRHAA